MKTLDEIKQMMAAGETAQADKALKDMLLAEPVLSLVYGKMERRGGPAFGLNGLGLFTGSLA